MADSYVQLNADGAGKKVDTRTEGTNNEHRQVFVLGDPTTNAGVAPVDATNGLAVDVKTLPPAASTSTKQSDGSQKTQVVDGAGNVIGATSNALDINIKSGNPTTISPAPATSGGLLVGNFTSGDSWTALTNSAQAIKASAGQLYGYYIYNPNAVASYIMIYNVDAASVVVGTTAAQMVICLPAGAAANILGCQGIEFTHAGWSIAAATTGGGNTAPTTALEAMIYYK